MSWNVAGNLKTWPAFNLSWLLPLSPSLLVPYERGLSYVKNVFDFIWVLGVRTNTFFAEFWFIFTDFKYWTVRILSLNSEKSQNSDKFFTCALNSNFLHMAQILFRSFRFHVRMFMFVPDECVLLPSPRDWVTSARLNFVSTQCSPGADSSCSSPLLLFELWPTFLLM